VGRHTHCRRNPPSKMARRRAIRRARETRQERKAKDAKRRKKDMRRAHKQAEDAANGSSAEKEEG